MRISRRDLLFTAVALPFAASARTTPNASLRPLSAWAERDHNDVLAYFAGRVDGAAIALPARAHAVVRDPAHRNACFIVARRPGGYLLRVDLTRGAGLARYDADDSCCFAGHAIVDQVRGRVLATEIDTLTGAGHIGVYDATTLRLLALWPSHGIGPHELLTFDRGTIAVANGGIITLPETGRIKRNLDTMAPSLALLDARDGQLQTLFTLPESRASIRHLALASDGTLGVALQIESEREMPLLATVRNGTLRFAEWPARPLVRYGAGVAACGDWFAVPCTRADGVAVWASDGAFIGFVPMRRPSGIVHDARGTGWLVSNEFGEIVRIDARSLQSSLVARSSRLWDNHLSRTA